LSIEFVPDWKKPTACHPPPCYEFSLRQWKRIQPEC